MGGLPPTGDGAMGGERERERERARASQKAREGEREMGGQGELSDRESERVREIKVLREITVRLTQAYDSLYAWLQAYAVCPDDNPRIVIESTLRACGL